VKVFRDIFILKEPLRIGAVLLFLR